MTDGSEHIYDYAIADVLKIVDGDTVDLRIETDWRGDEMEPGDTLISEIPWHDGGFHIEVKARTWVRPVNGSLLVGTNLKRRTSHRFRLLNVDTPERGQVNWAEATAFTRSWLTKPGLRVYTEKGDAFGRWLANVYDPATGEKLDDALLASGFAKVYMRLQML